MNHDQAYTLIRQTFTQAFEKARFRNFAVNLLNRVDDSKASAWSSQYVKDAFKDHVNRYERLGTYTSPDKEKMDVLIVHLTTESKLERARTAIRNFVADHLKTRDEKDAALVAFVSPTEKQWRFSYVKMEYATVGKESGKVGVETHLTPARRFSYIVGEGESCHTAQTRFVGLLQNTQTDPKLADIEEAFSVEAVTKEFFTQYRNLFEDIHAALEKLIAKEKTIRDEFQAKNVNAVDFAKKLMGQIVFLYFLQKKGWLGVAKGQDWGSGPRDFLRCLVSGRLNPENPVHPVKNIFNDILEPLFYDTLATDRGHEAWCNRFKCRIPFLNGGLFEPLGGYDWRKPDILLPNRLFTNTDFVEEGITGSGVLDVFDRYNFTVNEAEPLEKEVAIDPEMLGKVFENLIEENLRKRLGSYYTPREIVHYMCQESLINYLDTALNPQPVIASCNCEPKAKQAAKQSPRRDVEIALLRSSQPQKTLLAMTQAEPARKEIVPRADLETFVHLGEQISHYESVDTRYPIKMPTSIEQHARLMDDKLAEITICDPAVGSGAFLVGMMTEIVRARCALTPYFNDVHERTPYFFKRHAIQNCLYGVDIDPGAVEIAKLRLWLSLVVDEEGVKQIKPLPNLDYKIVAGNSLIGFPFRSQKLAAIDQLMQQIVDETDHQKKENLKTQIDRLLCEAFAGSKKSLGYEVNFDFEIYFYGVFHRKGGFDVVVGNPPYLESRSPAFEDALKTQLQEAVARRWSDMEIAEFIPRGSDLLIYFLEKGIHLVGESGVVALITQNAWLDTEYGRKFQRFLLLKTHVTLIVDSDFKHFDSSDGPNINTIISFFRGKRPSFDGYITFSRFHRDFSFAPVSASGQKMDQSTRNGLYRQYPYTSKTLKSTKWGVLLSLDDIVLDLLSLLEEKAQLLGKIHGCSLSIGQGLNLTKQYLLSPEQARTYSFLSKALIPIFTTEDGSLFDIQRTKYHLVNSANLSTEELSHARKDGIRPFDPTSTSKHPPILVMPRGIGRHFCAMNSARAFSASCVDVYATPSRPNDEIYFSLWAILNSSIAWLLREATGRKNLGGGMLKAEAVDMKDLPLFMSLRSLSEIKALGNRMRTREALDILHEIDTDDHRGLDELIFGHLKLPNEKRKMIVEALRRKVIGRTEKAKT